MTKQLAKRAADKPIPGGAQADERFMLEGKPLRVGDLLIDKDGRYYRVARFGHAYKSKDPAVFLQGQNGEGWGREESGQCEEEWNHYRNYTRLPGSIEDAEAEALRVIADPGALKLVAAIAKGDKAVGVFLGRRVGCKALAGEAGIVVRDGTRFLLEGKVKCGQTGCKNYGVMRIEPVGYEPPHYQCKKHGGAA